MSAVRWLLLAVIVAAVAAFFLLDLDRYLSFEALETSHAVLREAVAAAPWQSVLGFALFYVAITALSLPGAALLTLLAGAVFGFLAGLVIVSFASTIGATLAFLSSRLLFRDAVRRRFGGRLAALERGFERDGPFYLFTLRLVPAVPFFLVNLLMGLTPIRARTFYWVSQLGMLPGTLVYVNAGRELGRVESLAGILSPALVASFVALAAFPWAARALLERLRARRAYAGWERPRRFDRNLVVIGAGAAGLVASYVAAFLRAKVTLVERAAMGGDCLNHGCVPSKTLIHAARLAAELRRAHELGILSAPPEIDFGRAMGRVHEAIARIAPHDSVERYTALGVECLAGEARLVSPWIVEVGGRRLTTRAIVLATGAEPAVPPVPGLAEAGYYTSESIWGLQALPSRLLILGGGPVGCELAQCFARLGAAVTVVQRHPRLLAREDDEVGDYVRARLEAEGVRVLCGAEVTAVTLCDGVRHCALADDEIACDAILVAAGRRPRTAGFGLDALGIGLAPDGTVEVNEYLQTRFPHILACGDVAGPYQLTHAAAHQAWYAAVNALFGRLRRMRPDYSALPACTFVDPPVARVGLNEREARARGVACEVTRYDVDDLDRAITDGVATGFVKVLTAPGSDRVLGVTIVAAHAGELIAEMTLAMRNRLGLGRILATVHAYPTFAEANKYVAGAWRRAHAPERLLRWLARYHAWQRG